MMMLPLAFFTGSPADWMIILVLALVLFGPKRLPELGKQLGQAMREFRKISEEFTGVAHSIKSEVETAYEPIVTPYAHNQNTSSATVDAAVQHKVYDQEPHDLMAPAIPVIEHDQHNISAPPVEQGITHSTLENEHMGIVKTPPAIEHHLAVETQEKGH